MLNRIFVTLNENIDAKTDGKCGGKIITYKIRY